MTENALYEQLDKYNRNVNNNFNSNWGSLLMFINHDDTKTMLTQSSKAIERLKSQGGTQPAKNLASRSRRPLLAA
jgi:hypothetical protein